MSEVRMFKMPFATRHFNANQRVFVVFLTGAEAAYCIGKFRGKGRYVKAWVSWSSKAKPEPVIKSIKVTDAFAERLGIAWN